MSKIPDQSPISATKAEKPKNVVPPPLRKRIEQLDDWCQICMRQMMSPVNAKHDVAALHFEISVVDLMEQQGYFSVFNNGVHLLMFFAQLREVAGNYSPESSELFHEIMTMINLIYEIDNSYGNLRKTSTEFRELENLRLKWIENKVDKEKIRRRNRQLDFT